MSKKELHPAWKVCIGFGIVLFSTFFLAGQVLLAQQRNLTKQAQQLDEIQAQQKRGEERAYIARAVSGCMDIINDQEIEITKECTDARVAAYYPPSICQKLPKPLDTCGEKAVVVTK